MTHRRFASAAAIMMALCTIGCGRLQPTPQDRARSAAATADYVARKTQDILKLGNERLQEGRTSEATAIFREGLRLNPDSAPLHSALAQAFVKAGRTNDAIDEFGESLRLEPDNDNFHAGLAHLLFEKGDYLEASIHFKIVAKHNMGDPSALRWCAMSLIKLERWEDALEYVEAESRLKPGDEEVHNTLVSVQQSVERKKAAEKVAQERRDAERMK